MPRETAHDVGARLASGSYASPTKRVQIPLNDDEEEKAQRIHSRKALHTKQMEQYKAAASPARNRKSVGADGPQTPSLQHGVAGTAATPMKRVPLLANFEEWMKMATDNKINATNSWNFALIDYFHDMSLLKEGDGVNFQKASCTLDGCVKIYTSRVDSVATETGKLLSGLAASKEKKGRAGAEDDDGEDGEEDGEGEESGKKSRKKRSQRSAEETLASTFESLRLKKMELEFAVDPLFKKASADFDEGGAKGLLLNHLSIDGTGRIVFDSSDDAQPAGDEDRRDSMDPEGPDNANKQEEREEAIEDGLVDIASLGDRFFPNLDNLDDQEICPTLQSFELGSGDASSGLPFLKAPENWRGESVENSASPQQDGTVGFNHGGNFDLMDDDDGPGDFDIPADAGFGEGGEAWARDAALQPQLRVYDASAEADERGEIGTFDTNGQAYGVKLQHRGDDDQENILHYFDSNLSKNWAGPEHWKVAKIKEAAKPAGEKRIRKEKEPFEVDFLGPMNQELANALYTPASSNATISLPKREWRSRTRNLLPDDKHFNSRDLLKLFLKPKARMISKKTASHGSGADGGEVDEAYWASAGAPNTANADDGADIQGDYDANFFADDALPMPGGVGDDDLDEFADAREHFSPEADGPEGPGIDGVLVGHAAGGDGNNGAFGANLVAQSRRLRPEYVKYARVAKKVDVRRLKEEMWRGIGFSATPDAPPQTPSKSTIPVLSTDDQGELKFTSIMNNLRHVYPQKQLADISTSYGFICLLHLANEKGLVIENVEGWEDLRVRKDDTAIISEGDL